MQHKFPCEANTNVLLALEYFNILLIVWGVVVNYTGESWPSPANPGSIASAAAGHDALPGAVTTFTVGDAELLFAGNFERHGRDLIISDQTHHLVVPNYFSGGKRSSLHFPPRGPRDPSP